MVEESPALDMATTHYNTTGIEHGRCSKSEKSRNKKRRNNSPPNRDEMVLPYFSNERAQCNVGEHDQYENLVGDDDPNELSSEGNDSTHVDGRNMKKQQLAGSVHSSWPVGEASMSKEKNVKCKYNVDRRPQEHVVNGVSKNSHGRSMPLDPREWKENLETVKTSLDKSRKDVFPAPHCMNHSANHLQLVVGKRYSAEEDQIIKDAIFQCLKVRGIGEDESYKLFHCRTYPQVRGCWKEINAALPWRTYESLRHRAESLLHTGRKGRWSNEEIEILKRYNPEHGNGLAWKRLSELLGRQKTSTELSWHRYKLPNLKKGHWSQDEYQQLFDLVNKDLRMKAFDRKEVRNTHIRNNISWRAISKTLGTRNQERCSQKWYRQLTSPMVEKGLWLDIDDYRLLSMLSELDASCAEDVDWDNLVENRSSDICRRRWKEMTRHVEGKMENSFAELVEVLSLRYCKDMLDYNKGKLDL